MGAREDLTEELVNIPWRSNSADVVAAKLLAAGYRKPPTIENDKLVINDGMLLLEVGECTCTPYGSSHEAFCGYEYLDDLTKPLERAGYRKAADAVMFSDEAIERAAKAIRDFNWPDYEDQEHHPIKDYMGDARAAAASFKGSA